MNFKLAKIQGKLKGMEKVVEQMQGELIRMKNQVEGNDERGRKLLHYEISGRRS